MKTRKKYDSEEKGLRRQDLLTNEKYKTTYILL